MYNKKFLRLLVMVLKNRCKVTSFLSFGKAKSVKTAQIDIERAHFWLFVQCKNCK